MEGASERFAIATSGSKHTSTDLERSVLVVDDDRDFAHSLRDILTLEGYTVSIASSIDAAEQTAGKFNADVALVDIRLGRRNGIDLVDRFQNIFPNSLCVMMTAFASVENAIAALHQGAYDYLRKPFHHNDLMATLNRCFERIRLERERAVSERRYRSLYDETPAMFFTVDRDGTILSTNKYAAEQLGYNVEELVGTQMSMLYGKSDRIITHQYFESCFQNPNVVGQCEVKMVRRNRAPMWVRETGRAFEDTEGAPKVLLACEDVSEARELSEKLTYQAHHDALTGLINRHEFEQRLQRALETAQTNGAEHALCYLDLDQFKVINDTSGHMAGDELLRQLGSVLRAQVRQQDTLARLGGDEFGVLLEQCSLLHATRIADDLRRVISDFRLAWGEKSFSLGVSIGLVPIVKSSGTVAAVLSAADEACYAAKEDGRNRTHVYREDDSKVVERHGEMQWVARIKQALEDDRFQLYYQPIAPVTADADEGTYYEILLRMQDEEGSLVLPTTFLPAAERYNLSTKIDRWVINAAFTWLSRHPQHLQQLYLCCINLSGLSLADEDFLDFVMDRFRDTNVPPAKICFEVTETATIANLFNATRFFTALKELDCKFSLDDFGSGLSSFGYLKSLPVDFLKIDGVFVKEIGDDPVHQAMVKSINEIGHAMGKKTIAEFVETETILEKLKLADIGVDYAQGYAIARPQPIDIMLR